MILSLEILIKGEGNDVNLCNNHTLIHYPLPDNFPQLAPSPPQTRQLLLSLVEDVKVVALGHFKELFSFLKSYPCIQEV